MSDKWIRASEISDYVYCGRSWWLQRVRGFVSQNQRQLETGTSYHRQHGRLLQRATWARGLAYTLLFIIVAIITFEILVSLYL
jgi:hypothetical protein